MKLIQTPLYLTKKTDLFTAGASHMCNLHNAIIRGYNSIFDQAAHIQEADKSDFVGYALTWHKFVKSHHDDEEQTLFTKVEELLKDDTVFKTTHEEHGKSPIPSPGTNLTGAKAPREDCDARGL